MKKVAIVDYEMGNIDSVARAVEECGATALVTDAASDFAEASNIILPGVGSFSEGMRNLRGKGLDEILGEQVLKEKIPVLGICLGMQLFAEKGFEGGETAGLGWISGQVELLKPDSPETKIPHIGWNEVDFFKYSPIFEGILSGKDFYFVHSYRMVCCDDDNVIATTPYCGGFISAVCRENIFGVQFHPEKSQRFGLKLMKNFLSL
jgi:glutamine amidotransferase